MAGKGFHVDPGHLHRSGGKLGQFGEKLGGHGQRLQGLGQGLLAHTRGDRSGIGSVISRVFGRALGVTGKVFGEGGRVVGEAGKRLQHTAKTFEHVEGRNKDLLTGVHDGKKLPPVHSTTTSHRRVLNRDESRDVGGEGVSGPKDHRFKYRPDGQLERTKENINNVIGKYGIKLEPGATPKPDMGLRGPHGQTVIGRGGARTLRLGPKAFQNEEQLARTIYHENVHVRQINANGGRYPSTGAANRQWENEAWAEEKSWWKNHPLSRKNP